jgi:hypothetical protein
MPLDYTTCIWFTSWAAWSSTTSSRDAFPWCFVHRPVLNSNWVKQSDVQPRIPPPSILFIRKSNDLNSHTSSSTTHTHTRHRQIWHHKQLRTLAMVSWFQKKEEHGITPCVCEKVLHAHNLMTHGSWDPRFNHDLIVSRIWGPLYEQGRGKCRHCQVHGNLGGLLRYAAHVMR